MSTETKIQVNGKAAEGNEKIFLERALAEAQKSKALKEKNQKLIIMMEEHAGNANFWKTQNLQLQSELEILRKEAKANMESAKKGIRDSERLEGLEKEVVTLQCALDQARTSKGEFKGKLSESQKMVQDLSEKVDALSKRLFTVNGDNLELKSKLKKALDSKKKTEEDAKSFKKMMRIDVAILRSKIDNSLDALQKERDDLRQKLKESKG